MQKGLEKHKYSKDINSAPPTPHTPCKFTISLGNFKKCGGARRIDIEKLWKRERVRKEREWGRRDYSLLSTCMRRRRGREASEEVEEDDGSRPSGRQLHMVKSQK